MPPKLNLKNRLIFIGAVSFSLIFTLISAMTAFGLTSSSKTAVPAQLVLSLLMLLAWSASSLAAYRFHLRAVTMFHIVFWCCAIGAYLFLCILNDLQNDLPQTVEVLTVILGVPMMGYFSLIDILGVQNQIGCIILTLIPAAALAAVNIRFLRNPFVPKPKKVRPQEVVSPVLKLKSSGKKHGKH